MADMMEYPKTPNEFIKSYSFKDSDEIYTNGDELVQVYRVEQMLEHYYEQPKISLENKTSDWIPCDNAMKGAMVYTIEDFSPSTLESNSGYPVKRIVNWNYRLEFYERYVAYMPYPKPYEVEDESN